MFPHRVHERLGVSPCGRAKAGSEKGRKTGDRGRKEREGTERRREGRNGEEKRGKERKRAER
jgi:hypothetical protein